MLRDRRLLDDLQQRAVAGLGGGDGRGAGGRRLVAHRLDDLRAEDWESMGCRVQVPGAITLAQVGSRHVRRSHANSSCMPFDAAFACNHSVSQVCHDYTS